MDGALTPWEVALRYLPRLDCAPLDLARERIEQGCAQLWLGPECAGVTEVTDDNLLHIWTAGGAMRGLFAMLPDVEAFAKALGCRGMELTGRRGWQRIFPKYGFVCDGDRMVKVF